MAENITYNRLNGSSPGSGVPEVEEGKHQLLSVNETKSLQSRRKDVNLAKDTASNEEVNLAVPSQNNPLKSVPSMAMFRVPVGKSNYVERKPLSCKPGPKENPLAQVKKTLSEMEAQLEGHLPVSTSSRVPLTASDIGYRVVEESTDYMDHSAAVESSWNFRTQNAVSSLPALSTWKCMNDQPRSRSSSLAAMSKKWPHSDLSAGDCSIAEHIRSKSLSGSIYSHPVAPPIYSFHLPKSSTFKVSKKQNILSQKRPEDTVDNLEINNQAMSTYQSDYWACALPAHAPPFQDRQSPHWNPHKEYEDLLDYTYPLKPNYLCSREAVKEDLICDTLVHDSGVDLDSYSISPDSTVRSTVASFIDPCNVSRNYSCYREAKSSSVDLHFPPRASSPVGIGYAFRKSSSTFELPDSFEELSRICEMKPSTYFVSSSPEFYSHSSVDRRIKRKSSGVSSLKGRRLASGYIPTTWLLPLHKEWEIDEDYLALPCSVQELNTLANQLQNLSVEHKPLCNCRKGLDLDNSLDSGSEDSSSTLQLEGHKQQKNESKNENEDLSDSDTDYSFHSDQEDCSIDIAKGQGDGNFFGSINKISSLMDRLCETTTALHTSDEGDLGKEESLVHHIQKFCSKMEELIQWLYKVSETTENWVPPQPDAESIKSSLDRYMAFRRDIAEHQTLADTTLSIGEHLMACMTSISPGLKHALGLIEKQAVALDRHAEGFYTSILSAMDSMKEDLSSKCEAQDMEAAQMVCVV
ncbi:centrosomal protein of 68 kDa [Protopterus annectens]|uniref:centrosomal protein of 68 kDa n=1 Tax=Protopterus annectens TaxID=7888 RepID=UPI001CFA0B09|nr:centrosomal protein of 68 kDa [Protopterus annectens]